MGVAQKPPELPHRWPGAQRQQGLQAEKLTSAQFGKLVGLGAPDRLVVCDLFVHVWPKDGSQGTGGDSEAKGLTWLPVLVTQSPEGQEALRWGFSHPGWKGRVQKEGGV